MNDTQIRINKKMIIKYLKKNHVPKAHPGCLITLNGNIKKVGLNNNILKNRFCKGGSLKKFKALDELIMARPNDIIIRINKTNTMRS